MANNFWLSQGLAESLVDGGSMYSVMNDGFIDIYAGTIPVDASTGVGGATLLCRVSLDGDGIAGLGLTRVGRTLRKPNTAVWAGENLASGVATFYRHVLSGDTGGLSTTAPRMQGTVGTTSAAEMMLLDTTFVLGETFLLNNFVLEQPLSA